MCEISIVASCTTFMLQLFYEQSDLEMAVSDLDSSFIMAPNLRVNF